MATSSILHDIVIKTEENAKSLVSALEQSEKWRIEYLAQIETQSSIEGIEETTI